MPVMGPLDHLADPHLLSRAAFDEVEHPVGGIEHHIANPTAFRAHRPLQGRLPVWVPTPDGSSPSGSDSTTPSWTVSPKPVPSLGPGGSVSGVKRAVDQRIDEGLPRGLDDVLAHPIVVHSRGPSVESAEPRDRTGALARVENTHLEVGEADAVERRVDVAECVAQGGVGALTGPLPSPTAR